MKKIYSFAILLLLAFSLYAQPIGPFGVTKTKGTASFLVAASDAPADVKRIADYRCDGVDDQNEVNAAIDALPAGGGKIVMSSGIFNLNKTAETDPPRAVSIEDSNVVLEGMGASSKFILGDNQDCCMFRIIGDGIGNIIIRDLYIDGNRSNNSHTDNYETCGIKAKQTSTTKLHDITVENCFIEDCVDLCIMMYGANNSIIHNRFGEANSDICEFLDIGPGQYIGNYVEVDAATGFCLGSDNADNITILGNTVHIKPGGRVSGAVFRLWPDRKKNIVCGNRIYVDAGGKVDIGILAGGWHNVITDNQFFAADGQSVNILVKQGGGIVSNNYLHYGSIVAWDFSESQFPLLITNNVVGELDNEVTRASNPHSACIGYWKMNDNAASTVVVADIGPENAAAQHNTDGQTTSGKIDTALNCNGNDYINAGHHADLEITGDKTYVLWFKPVDDTLWGSYEYLSQKGALKNYISLMSSGSIRAHFEYSTTDALCQSIASEIMWVGGSWNFLAVVIRNKRIHIYLNGVMEVNPSVASGYNVVGVGTPDDLSAEDLIFGGGHNYFDGAIDNVMFFNRALTRGEIAYLYNDGDGRDGFASQTVGKIDLYNNRQAVPSISECKSEIRKNTSGGSLAVGDVVIADATGETYNGSQCITTTAQGDDKVLGVVAEVIADDAYGRIQTIGKVTTVKVDGTADIAIGDLLGTFTSAGIAMKAASGDMAFAIALEAYTANDSNGIIDALLIKPRKI